MIPKETENLAVRLRQVLGETVTIARPVIRSELRLFGLDSVSVAEVGSG